MGYEMRSTWFQRTDRSVSLRSAGWTTLLNQARQHSIKVRRCLRIAICA